MTTGELLQTASIPAANGTPAHRRAFRCSLQRLQVLPERLLLVCRENMHAGKCASSGMCAWYARSVEMHRLLT